MLSELLRRITLRNGCFLSLLGRQLEFAEHLLVFGGDHCVPLLIFSLTRIVSDNFQTQKKIANVEKQNLQTELKFLRSQIQSHILFNSLNSLYDFTVRKSDKAPQLVLELSKVLRYVLYEGDRASIPWKMNCNSFRNLWLCKKCSWRIGERCIWKSSSRNLTETWKSLHFCSFPLWKIVLNIV